MKLRFRHDPTETKRAMVAAFDLGGFSDFCNHPDAAVMVPRLVSELFALFDQFTVSSWKTWLADPDPGKVVEPTFAKFTGDGALLLWVQTMDKKFEQKHRTGLVQAMRNFQRVYEEKASTWEADWQANKLPKKLRVGIAVGTVCPVFAGGGVPTDFSDPVDYVGYCINLAVRLQSHYRELGFMVQKSVGPQVPGLVEVMARGIKGAHDEAVLVFESDREELHRKNPGLYITKLSQPIPSLNRCS